MRCSGSVEKMAGLKGLAVVVILACMAFAPEFWFSAFPLGECSPGRGRGAFAFRSCPPIPCRRNIRFRMRSHIQAFPRRGAWLSVHATHKGSASMTKRTRMEMRVRLWRAGCALTRTLRGVETGRKRLSTLSCKPLNLKFRAKGKG